MEKTKFYKYFFRGLAKPIIMETTEKIKADEMLSLLEQKSNTNINMSLLEDVRIEMPIIGISQKKRNGIDLVWVGKENSADGWIEKLKFDEIEHQNSKNK